MRAVEVRRFSSLYHRRELVRIHFKDIASEDHRAAEVLLIELQRLARETAQDARMRFEK